MEPLDQIEQLATLARIEEPPPIHIDGFALAQRCRPAQPPVAWLWSSAGASALAACVVLALTLRLQTQSIAPTQTALIQAAPAQATPTPAPGTGPAATISPSTSDINAGLFSPLRMEVP